MQRRETKCRRNQRRRWERLRSGAADLRQMCDSVRSSYIISVTTWATRSEGQLFHRWNGFYYWLQLQITIICQHGLVSCGLILHPKASFLSFLFVKIFTLKDAAERLQVSILSFRAFKGEKGKKNPWQLLSSKLRRAAIPVMWHHFHQRTVLRMQTRRYFFHL